jgi:hypothetical protein
MLTEEPDWFLRASEPIKLMYRYWLSKCQGDNLPRRADIDPVEMPRGSLPNVTIVEVVPDPRRYVYRLVGTREVEIRGNDPTGKSVPEAFFGPSLEDALHCYDMAVATRRPYYDLQPFNSADGRFSDDEDLFLPLSDDGISVNRILVFGTVSPVPIV